MCVRANSVCTVFYGYLIKDSGRLVNWDTQGDMKIDVTSSKCPVQLGFFIFEISCRV